MKNNLIQQKSFDFALRIVNACRFLVSEKKEFILSKQLIRSGTSIGANVEEAIGAHSTADFLSKLTIAYKESRETSYWIRLLCQSNYLEQRIAENLQNDVEEICRIISKIQITTKKNLATQKQQK